MTSKNLRNTIEKVMKNKSQQMKIVSFNVNAESFDIVRKYLERQNISFSAVIDLHIKDLAGDVKLKKEGLDKK